MRALTVIAASSDKVTVESNAADRFQRLFDWIKRKAEIGTGVTVTAVDNGGARIEIYIDGDGADRVNSVRLERARCKR